MAETKPSPAVVTECAKATRRRGEVLEAAIREAALCVLAEVGFDRLTMDLVAERAGTSKRVLYRRWPNKVDLVVDAIEVSVADIGRPVPNHGSLRADLIALLVESAAFMRARDVNTMLRLAMEVGARPELQRVGRSRVLELRRDSAREVIQRAVDRGEARPGALADEAVMIGFSLLFIHTVADRGRLTRSGIEAIVDAAWMPALRA